MKFLGVFKRIFNWFKGSANVPLHRPSGYSKNAWSYIGKGKMTPALGLYVRWGR